MLTAQSICPGIPPLQRSSLITLCIFLTGGTDPALLIRKITIGANHILNESDVPEEVQEQPDLFADHEALAKQKATEDAELAKERRLQDAMLSIKKQFGKNAVLKAMSLQEGATAKDRNQQVGGHKA